MLPASLLAVFSTLLFLSSVQAASNKVLEVSFPSAPASSTNVVHDNFLGISWELYPMNYLCELLFACSETFEGVMERVAIRETFGVVAEVVP